MPESVAGVGRRGTIVIPSRIRARYGLQEATQGAMEERAEGLLLKPVVTVPVEIYTPERKAEFVFNNAIPQEDYDGARRACARDGFGPGRDPYVPLPLGIPPEGSGGSHGGPRCRRRRSPDRRTGRTLASIPGPASVP